MNKKKLDNHYKTRNIKKDTQREIKKRGQKKNTQKKQR